VLGLGLLFLGKQVGPRWPVDGISVCGWVYGWCGCFCRDIVEALQVSAGPAMWNWAYKFAAWRVSCAACDCGAIRSALQETVEATVEIVKTLSERVSK
jgi:hypothetical protein